ncbi:curlin [Shewanella sp. 202IG2-18]|uniref:curlin n=1 Tax=Parashewanella hymeniacidonis TaxID=2807618 RepID=UPI0019618C64|nr:curlin [Parashewanella hymeniacidonis]
MNQFLKVTLLSFVVVFSSVASSNDDEWNTDDVAISLSLESLLINANRENLISLLQSGSNNEAALLQIGSNNIIDVIQLGHNNLAVVNQYGNGNEVELNQLGDNNVDVITQIGNDNLVQIDSLGNTGFIIQQNSDNAVLRISQFN